MLLLVDHDRRDLGRRQGVDDELRRVFREENDVHTLAGKFVGHRRDARTAHADASPLRVEPRIVRLDRDFRADARVACSGLDFDQAFLDFGNLELEEAHQKLRRDSRQDELRALCRAVDLGDKGADPVADAQHLLRDQLVARDHALDATGFDDHVAALDAFGRAGQEVVLPFEEIVKNLLSFGVADFLQNHLFCRLGTNPTEFHRFERLFDHVTELELGVALRRIGDGDLVRGLLVFFVEHDGPASKRLVVAGLAIDGNAGVDLQSEALFRRGGERRLERGENDFLGHVLFPCQRIDQQQ